MGDSYAFERLAYLCYQMIEGDDVLEEVLSILRERGFVDENDEWIFYNEEEDS